MREIYRTAGTVSFLKWNRVTVVSDSGKQTDHRIISQPVVCDWADREREKDKTCRIRILHRKNISKLLAWSDQDLS